jgi:hypothetical protein
MTLSPANPVTVAASLVDALRGPATLPLLPSWRVMILFALVVADADQAKYLALFSARTTRGEMISGIAVSNFVAYEPPAMPINRGFDVGLNKLRMFRLSVRPDGTVASATPYVSFGNEDLDSRSIKWLMKWRFQPNSVTEVRMPVSWVYTYR